MRRPAIIGILATALAAACTPDVPDNATVSADQAARLFERTCLDTLPEFDAFPERIDQLGLSYAGDLEGIDMYNVSGRALFAGTQVEDDVGACKVAFYGDWSEASVGEVLLQTVESVVGQNSEKFRSDFFEYAYYLENKSMLTYAHHARGGQMIHLFAISRPIDRSEIDKYIYE
ncbi:MAG: hypothetical protein AAF667_14830 [Pseudomonadota bacterium]